MSFLDYGPVTFGYCWSTCPWSAPFPPTSSVPGGIRRLMDEHCPCASCSHTRAHVEASALFLAAIVRAFVASANPGAMIRIGDESGFEESLEEWKRKFYESPDELSPNEQQLLRFCRQLVFAIRNDDSIDL